MRKLTISDAEGMRIAIRQEIGRSEESRYDHRLHGLLLVASGHSCGEVGELFDEDARTIQRWVQRFERGGLEALRDAERSGRPCSLDARQWRRLGAELRRSPREFGHEQNLWDRRLLSEHLKVRYKVKLGVRQCHGNVPWESFTPGGPIALLPYRDRYALVWTCPSATAELLLNADEGEFLSRLQAEFGGRAGRFLHSGPRLRFEVRNVRATVVGDMAVHLVDEVVTVVEEGREAFLHATNVYRRTARGWRMVLHHASPAASSRRAAPPLVH